MHRVNAMDTWTQRTCARLDQYQLPSKGHAIPSLSNVHQLIILESKTSYGGTLPKDGLPRGTQFRIGLYQNSFEEQFPALLVMNDPFTKGNERAVQMTSNVQKSVCVLDIEKKAQPMHRRIGKRVERKDEC